jgi:FKBP-type peptidyl-prolyl cis-trans isomerase
MTAKKQPVPLPMCRCFILVLACGLSPLNAGAAQEASALTGEKEKLSYAVGLNLGNQLRAQSIDVDADPLTTGLRDALSGGKPLLTEQEVRGLLNGLQNKMKRKQVALQGEMVVRNKKEGEAFLAENKARDGVVALESGLQYKILKAADGKKPTADDTVVCHYRGTLIDGTEFDSSYKRKQPATFQVQKVIKGWTEALQLMPVGSKWQLFIPSGLAYGQRGTGRGIGPNATLVFEVELIAIEDPPGDGARASKRKDSIPPAAGHGQRTTGNDARSEVSGNGTLAATSGLTGITVSFKVDPRLTRSLYMGDRWVSPPTYTRVGEGKSVTVEARAHGRDTVGQAVNISATWTPTDPDMVTVTPNGSNEVRITVLRAGESSLQVTSEGVSKELAIRATDHGNTLQLDIAQGQ